MSERKQVARSGNEAADQPEVQAADLRDAGLDEAVECCLAEIDAALDDLQAEKDKAKAEYEEISARFREKQREAYNRYNNSVTDQESEAAWRDACAAVTEAEDALRMLQAKYAHLGVEAYICCDEPNFYMPDGEQ